MKQFTLLADTTIGWDIIGIYLAVGIISLVIFYYIVKAAVKNGIIEARNNKISSAFDSNSNPERIPNVAQIKLQQRMIKVKYHLKFIKLNGKN